MSIPSSKSDFLRASDKYLNVDSFSPAMVETPFAATAGLDFETFKKKSEPLYPIRRIGQVCDTTSACLYLASDDASFITGILLPVDGGFLNASAY